MGENPTWNMQMIPLNSFSCCEIAEDMWGFRAVYKVALCAPTYRQQNSIRHPTSPEIYCQQKHSSAPTHFASKVPVYTSTHHQQSSVMHPNILLREGAQVCGGAAHRSISTPHMHSLVCVQTTFYPPGGSSNIMRDMSGGSFVKCFSCKPSCSPIVEPRVVLRPPLCRGSITEGPSAIPPG